MTEFTYNDLKLIIKWTMNYKWNDKLFIKVVYGLIERFIKFKLLIKTSYKC